MLRSKESLDREIRARSRLHELANAAIEHDDDGWVAASIESNLRRRDEAIQESREAGDGFEWAFDGVGIYGSRITVQRLAEIADPLAQTMRWVARDLTTETTSIEQTDPIITRYFAGSFGIAIDRPPVSEQLTFDGSTSFDRSADRVVAVFSAARDRDVEALMDSLTGLKQNALSGLAKLSRTIAVSDKPTWMRWRGSEVVTVTAESAALVVELVDQADTYESPITVVGRLDGGGIEAGTFTLIEDSPPERHYRGRLGPGVTLAGVQFGALVRAEINEVRVVFSLRQQARETHTLVSLEQIGPPREAEH